MTRYRRDRTPYREPPDENKCRCVNVDDKALLIDDDCPVHGSPEPPEPDHHQLDLELDPRWTGNFPKDF